jgi:hypothetical protein
VPGTGREPALNERQLHARRRVHRALQALGGISSPAGSCMWHVVGLQRSVREWAMRQGWGGRPVRQKQAQGILIAALEMLVAHAGYRDAASRHIGECQRQNSLLFYARAAAMGRNRGPRLIRRPLSEAPGRQGLKLHVSPP